MVEFKSKYTINQYIRLAKEGLILDEDIIDFQKKMMIIKGDFPYIEGGLTEIYTINQAKSAEVRDLGKRILCKCGSFYSLTLDKIKIKKNVITLELNGYHCGNNKIKMSWPEFLLLGRAGIIKEEFSQLVRGKLEAEFDDFSTDQSYGLEQSILSDWVKEQLGMSGEEPERKCYICGTPVTESASHCPRCRSEL
jgi:hypothetical protein